jgi:hypothetical protein
MRLVLLLVVSCLASPVHAQSAWPGLPVPTASLALVDVTLDHGRTLVAQRLIRVLHSAPREGDIAPEVLAFERLLTDLDAFEHEALRTGTRGLSLAMATNATERAVLQDVLKVLGLRLRERRGIYSVEANRDDEAVRLRKRLDSAGIDTAGIEKSLNEGQTVMPKPAVTILPSPIPHDVWESAVFARQIPPGALFSSIIRDRQASLLFHGLASMTPGARAFLAAHPELLQRLYRGGAEALAAFGGSLHLERDGRISLPGGAEATELWEALTEERLERSDRFIRSLFERDAGRLAYFLDAITHLDTPHQRFALGLWIHDRGIRLDRLRALYRVFVDIEPKLSVVLLPFARPQYDPAILLELVAVGPQGDPASPSYRRLWDKAFDGVDLPRPGARELTEIAEDGIVDAAWLAEHLLEGLFTDRRGRLECLTFGQRVFASAPPGELEDVLVALRAFGRFPALMMTIERIGVRRPATYARAARRARELEDVADRSLAVPVLAQFQGALAILERIARTGSVPAARLDDLVSSLAGLPVSNGQYEGALASWLDRELLPSLPSNASDGDRRLELNLLTALAEKGESTAPFEWEGTQYVPDVTGASLRDLIAVRAKQGGNSLDAVLAIARTATAFESDDLTLESLKTHTASLKADAGALVAARAWPDAPDDVPDTREVLDRVLRDLGKISKPKDVSKSRRIARPVVHHADYLLGETLVALAYAPQLGNPADLLGPQADLSHRHSFGLTERPGVLGVRRAWQSTGVDTGQKVGQAYGNSLFGLDLILSSKRLRRLSTDTVPNESRLNSNDSNAFVNVLALLNPRELRNEDLASIGSAMARGRARLRAAAADAGSLDELAGIVSMSAARRQLISWTMQQEPERVEFLFSPAELFWLGREERFDRLDAWGTSFEPLSGCFCLRFPTPGSWDRRAGRPGGSQLGAAIPDLTLRVAEHLTALKVPVALFPGVLAMATQDFIDNAKALYEDDWQGVVGHADHLSREMIEDYVAAVVAAGPVRLASSQEASK